ncbi:FAD-binding domain-containing protein [Aspergillus bertholletiae]|uniref:FAD-binding domain-containing protein n=1 Tax=Aspergillus bertholletiae TaxID=1226010 RepID=A0A5N7AP12_9EURO|nr:FAD-binding domain-containing protein [Aspergillus bertholletiae]
MTKMRLSTGFLATLATVQGAYGADRGSSPCCEALRLTSLRDQVFYQNSARYQQSIQSYWSLDVRLYPTCIVQLYSAQDVSLAVSTLVEANDQSPRCQFAIRSGGHTTVPGANSVQHGVTIDLSGLNSTTYDPKTSVASIHPGARWRSVYSTLGDHSVAVSGGRAGTVGVGGLVTGGGNSFFAAQYGLACDSVVNFEVVLADGRIVNANKTSNADLWKALKGGSSNFGVVTRIDLEAFKQGKLWGGVVSYDNRTTPEQISALVNFTNHIADDPHASLIPMYRYTANVDSNLVSNALHYSKPTAYPAAFDAFYRLPNVSTSTRFDTLYGFTNELGQEAGLHNVFLTLTFKNDPRVIQHAVSIQNGFINEAKASAKSKNYTLCSLFQPFPSLFGKIGNQKGGNVLGLDESDDDHILYLIDFSWENSADNDFFNALGHQLLHDVESYAERIHADYRYIYLNYAGPGQNPLRSYGEHNLMELATVAEKYDPSGVFQTQVPGGFKTSQSSKFLWGAWNLVYPGI